MTAADADPGGLARHLPNLLTALRILAAPVVFVWLLQSRFAEAGWLALAAMATDLLDGFVARRFSWESRLGGLLDPLADKLLMAACFIGLALVGAVPAWLAVLVLLRDGVIIGGATAYHVWIGRLRAQPSRLGKLCTAVQAVYLLALLLELALDRSSSLWSTYAVWGVGALVLVSGVDYVLRWSRRARDEVQSKGGSGP